MFSFIEKVNAQSPIVINPTNTNGSGGLFAITELGKLISAIVSVLLIVAALAAFLYLVLGGIQWITSGGDKAGMEAARNKITQAIVGLVIVAASYAIMLLVSQFLGISISSGLTLPTPF